VIVIAAGGTGGHFFPAEALATELLARGRRIALMTDARSGGLQSAVFAGHEHYVIRGAGIAGRGVVRAARAAVALAAGTVQARSVMARLGTAAVVGFGGYPSVAPVLATRLMRHRPTVILHEQNAVLGRANRFLARHADALALSFADTTRVPEIAATVVTGNPVRPAIAALAGAAYAPPGDMVNLLVLGGSLGARVFSDVVPPALATLPEHLRARLSVVQQCRPEDLDRVRGTYAQAGIAAELAAFFPDVADRLARAHLVIARAGASTVAELAVAGRPSILVPLPGAIDDHQAANARALSDARGASVIAQTGFTPPVLAEHLTLLLKAPDMLAHAALAARLVARADATARLADLVEDLMRKNTPPPLEGGEVFFSRRAHMRALPLSIGTIHFVGIGGIGMSGIAEVLHNLGYSVQGSDIADSANVKRLRDAGIPVAVGHDAANLGAAQVVVVSSAVKRDNPEIAAARTKLIPVVRRAEMLAELMRLRWSIAVGGTHGKTTTTSLVAAVLEAAKLDPTVINGGIINAYGTNTRLGAGDWMVVEADESDGSFLRLPAVIAVVTNMDPEHLDHWGTPEAMIAGYDQFVANVPFYGFAVLCIDHPSVQQMIPRLSDHRIITYGFSPQADVRAERVVPDKLGSTFEVIVTDRARNRQRRMGPFRLPMLGSHNVQNALAAVAVGLEMEIDDATLRSAFLGFKGVKRRFTKTGEAGGITVIDDYGHHPVEIAAVLKAARQAGARDVIAVVQPHRYTRLHSLFDEFCTCMNDAGHVIVADVYPAGEAPIEGMNRDALVEGLRARGHRSVVPLPSPARLAEMVHAMARSGDYVVCLGAGSITQWATTLPAELTALQAAAAPRRAAGGER
jgi:UDP-N-acetylmuramate--alanine ligase